jgi:hypothetical protein
MLIVLECVCLLRKSWLTFRATEYKCDLLKTNGEAIRYRIPLFRLFISASYSYLIQEREKHAVASPAVEMAAWTELSSEIRYKKERK